MSSFEELYRAEYQRMVRVAFLLVGGGAAEEVTQDAFARVFERWGTLDRPAGYLRMCVVNGSRDVLRRRRLAMWRRPDPVPDPLLGADELLDALSCLPPTRRAAVVLRYYEDLSEADIASALGVRPGTVKSMLHRSLQQLREVIER
ncbi:MAG: sigma factor-like helix-turn-helix DNA-binding protein [Acidimicrobiales bacterium]|nr:SigE family RNA polymerase sigma factor [Actinomycetota bacterium]